MSKENLPEILFQFENPRYINKEFEDVKTNTFPRLDKELIKPHHSKTVRFDEKSNKEYAYKDIMYTGTVSEFSTLFFSKKNIKEIQNRIRNTVYNVTNKEYLIGEQDETNLVITMKSIYNKFGRDELDKNYYKESLNYLDDLVVKKCVPLILSGIKSYILYLRDVSKPRGSRSLPNPESTSISGTKNYI